ncbi:hypothetical protein AYI69_g7023, partial [Smittium culicis]
MAMKCEQLAVKEASLYNRLMELQSDSSQTGSASGKNTLRNIPKIPSFDGYPISFYRWIFGVDELFKNSPGLRYFQKRILFVDSSMGDPRSWYDADPYRNIDILTILDNLFQSNLA